MTDKNNKKTIVQGAVLAAAAVAVMGVPASAQQTGPIATYWVSVSTTSGMGYGSQAAVEEEAPPAPAAKPAKAKPKAKKPGFGSIMGAVVSGATGLPVDLGGGGGAGAQDDEDDQADQAAAAAYARSRGIPGFGGGGPTRSLMLQLGSTQKPAAAPAADHLIPAGLGMGPSLPLVTPRQARPEPRTDYMPPEAQGQKPKGKMLIYWGCGEHAAAPPIVIDFAKLGQGAAPNFPTVAVNAPQPPSPGRFATYGEWPNERSNTPVPARASLVGAHTVQGNYSPPINFTLGAGQDFMAPLSITTRPSAAGGSTLSWNAVPTATGYFAWLMGASSKSNGETMVLWSSSAQAVAFSALMDYLPPGAVRRLIGTKVVLPPTVTTCTVPAEVLQGGVAGMVQMIAYGDEANFVDPPKPTTPKTPWNLKTAVKVRFKSTGSTMVGMGM
jgi:hypothetical protein